MDNLNKLLENLKYRMLKLVVRYSEDNSESLQILSSLLKDALIIPKLVNAVPNVFEVHLLDKGVKSVWSETF